jgi:hypothetical protein
MAVENDIVLLLGGVYDFQTTNRKEGEASHNAAALVGGFHLSLRERYIESLSVIDALPPP